MESQNLASPSVIWRGRDADNLTLHIYHWTAAGAGRDRRSDLDDSAKGWYVAHCQMISLVTLPSRPNGLPITTTLSPS